MTDDRLMDNDISHGWKDLTLICIYEPIVSCDNELWATS